MIEGVVLGGVLSAVATYHLTKRRMEKKHLYDQNHTLKTHVSEVNAVYTQMRAWKHDFHNHLQLMQAYLKLEKYEEMKGHLTGLVEDMATLDPLVRSGNVMLDAIINCKLTPIREQGCTVHAKATVLEGTLINEVQLCAIIGNLLDNAIESVKRLETVQEGFIRVYIRPMENQLYISVTNAMSAIPKQHFKSSKRINEKGFGLMRIDYLVNKLGGYVNRQFEEGVFATEVMLPFVRQ